ncbi:hypothetical protein AQJ64_00245 [Streptomyces griseoruber]|uniref:Secreted protein n=1 Tax=Streptomyces griseoruber TaxID=1943 RepID=A0A101TBE7_9ACTN|nr:hypothetical protein AQJ64_00245 [Streptomyces griseoruber]
MFNPRSPRSPTFSSVITSVTALAVLGVLAVHPGQDTAQPVVAASDSYDGFDTKAAEQLREDQCVAADALRNRCQWPDVLRGVVDERTACSAPAKAQGGD